MPGTSGAINLPTYKETKEKNDAVKSMQEKQFANLPDKLMNTMKREKKPFTYTPLAVGDNGKLDLNQIKSPKMKKRLMANMEDEKVQDENRIESIDSSLQNNKNQDLLDRELSSPSIQLKPTNTNQSSSPSYLSEATFTPSTQTKQSLYVPLSVLNENDNYQNFQPILPQRETTFNYDYNRPLSPDQKLDQLLNDQLKRSISPTTDLNNNHMSNLYSDQGNQFDSKPQYYGNVKPKKINFAQELADERNFNCVPSSSNQPNYNQINYNQTPKLWSNQPSSAKTVPIQIEVQKDKPQYYSNSQLGSQKGSSNYSPIDYERSQSQQNGTTYQIPIINQNNNQSKITTAPVPPQRQQSLNRTNLPFEKEIPIDYEEPLQSKSFKILQKLTADIENEVEKLKLIDQQNKAIYRDPLEDKLPAYYGTLNHIEQPRIRSERRIPIQVEGNNNFSFPEYHSKNEQNWIYQNGNFHSTPVNSSFWTEPEWVPQIPAHKQRQSSDRLLYQGANIPSRTFRLLQMLSNEDDW